MCKWFYVNPVESFKDLVDKYPELKDQDISLGAIGEVDAAKSIYGAATTWIFGERKVWRLIIRKIKFG